MRRAVLFCLVCGAGCDAGGGDPEHRQDPFEEQYDASCEELPAPEVYTCAEQEFWDVLRTDHEERLEVWESMGRLAQQLESDPDHEARARLHFQRGQLAMALALENGHDDLIFQIVPEFDAALALTPDDPIIPVWKDSMEVAFANVLQDEVALVEAADRAWKHVADFPLGNVLSISGTTIGTPLRTGIPQKTIELLDGWECEGVPWCEDNTWTAPFAVPGLNYHFAEAYARVGDRQRTLEYLEAARSSPDYDVWPYRHVVEDASADVDALLARFAAYGDDESPFDVMYANQSYGCVFCHAPASP
jgi:tetratricopeptide (TPR) repeat protein